MDLETHLKQAFPDGLPYNDAAQLCLRLYCTVDVLPAALQAQCSKEGLAEVFAGLSRQEFMIDRPLTAARYGATFHDVWDKGHWIEVIASVFKKGDTVDAPVGRELAERLLRLSR
jgi:hypothetical protein